MNVAPYMGAWIETRKEIHALCRWRVAPYMGAWIETPLTPFPILYLLGRTLHGCVD